jgi:hypothetical protein
MSDYVRATEDVLADRNKLADQVCQALRLAGLAAFRQPNSDDAAGAEVEVDPGDDAAGGVFVTWNPHRTISEAVIENLQTGRLQAPVIQHSGAIASHMMNAMVGILRSAGFQADASDDDMRPMTVHVASR